MASTVKQNLGLAVRTLLKPLVKLLISQGITHGDLSEAAKDVYVEMALRHFSDGKLNKSKIAVLTGLTRKEVANVIGRASKVGKATREFSRPGRVLAGWHSDPVYVGPYGVPLPLRYDSPDGGGKAPSFLHLCKTYSGDMSPKSMLDQLTRVGAVVVQDNDTLKVVRRDFEPSSLSPAIIERFGEVGFYQLSTIATNVEKKGSGKGPFDRVVVADTPLTQNELERFDLYLKENLQKQLETIDNYLSTMVKARKGEPTTEKTFDTGVAMVHYIDWHPEDRQTLHDLLKSMDVVAGANDVEQ